MPFQKTINLPAGDTGNHIRLGPFRWDPVAREASIQFALYKSEAHYLAGAPAQLPVIAKLRLKGEQFDYYLGADVLASASIAHQIELAAAQTSINAHQSEEIDPDAEVISDFGAALFATATPV